MKTSKEISEIFKALVKAQAEMGNAKKGSKNDAFFNSKYSNLESVINAVKEPLNNNGLAVLQAMGTRKSGTQYIETVVLHTSGQWVRSRTNIVVARHPELPPLKDKYGKDRIVNNTQAEGSAITYAKRYGLQSLLMIPSSDDDGNANNERPKKPLSNTTKVLSIEDEIKSYIEKDRLRVKKILETIGVKAKTIKEMTVPEQVKLLRELREEK